jgi:urease accessory protein
MQTCERGHVAPRSLIRLQNWLSPAFPIGSYSYSHGLEWAIESNQVRDRTSLADWLDADLRYGSARNDATLSSKPGVARQADIVPGC